MKITTQTFLKAGILLFYFFKYELNGVEGPAYLKNGIRGQKQTWPPRKGSVDCQPNNLIQGKDPFVV